MQRVVPMQAHDPMAVRERSEARGAMTAVADVETKPCSKCSRDLPLSEFNRTARGRLGREAECRACKLKGRHRSELIAARPDSPEAVNQAVDEAPDRKPAVTLREELERRRCEGRPWSSAWPLSVSAAVRAQPPVEAASWRRAFNDTKGAWHGSYTGTPWPVAVRPLFVPDDEPVAA